MLEVIPDQLGVMIDEGSNYCVKLEGLIHGKALVSSYETMTKH